jgi:hypothetical protein
MEGIGNFVWGGRIMGCGSVSNVCKMLERSPVSCNLCFPGEMGVSSREPRGGKRGGVGGGGSDALEGWWMRRCVHTWSGASSAEMGEMGFC